MGRILNEFHVLDVIWPFILSLQGNDMCFLVPSFFPWLYSFFSGRYKKNLEPTPAGADRTGLTVLKVPHVISLQGLSIPLFSSLLIWSRKPKKWLKIPLLLQVGSMEHYVQWTSSKLQAMCGNWNLLGLTMPSLSELWGWTELRHPEPDCRGYWRWYLDWSCHQYPGNRYLILLDWFGAIWKGRQRRRASMWPE